MNSNSASLLPVHQFPRNQPPLPFRLLLHHSPNPWSPPLPSLHLIQSSFLLPILPPLLLLRRSLPLGLPFPQCRTRFRPRVPLRRHFLHLRNPRPSPPEN